MKYVQVAICGLLVGMPAAYGQERKPGAADVSAEELQGRQLLDQAKSTLQKVTSLLVDYQSTGGPSEHFSREGEIALARPNKFSVVRIRGMTQQRRELLAMSDGLTVTRIDWDSFISYRTPLLPETFYVGHNYLVQFFFDPGPIGFDPTDRTWAQAVSLFDRNVAAYDDDVRISHIGRRSMEGRQYDVVSVRYNTKGTDIRQQIYIGEDKLIYQVDTSLDGELFSQKFRNYRVGAQLPPETFQLQKPVKMPLQDSNPLRLGKPAPDFNLPGYSGGELSLKKLMQGKKGAFVAVLDGTTGRAVPPGPDGLLATMRMIQQIKDKFEKQGLVVICIVGSPQLMPDLVSEMKLNWMPDVTRFDYPIAVDIDVERGIQGSAFESFKLNGRDVSLLDSQGRVVFASYGFSSVNLMAFVQALGQIGFSVSPSDIEALSR